LIRHGSTWWQRAPYFIDRALRDSPGQTDTRQYRFGHGRLELDSDDQPLNLRFRQIYPEGPVELPGGRNGSVRVRCTVRSLDEPQVAAIAFEDPEDLDAAEFCRTLFPDRNYIAGPAAAPGWETLSLGESPRDPLVAMKGHYVVADRRQVWQPLIANIAVNRVLRLQRDVLFFHAASTQVADSGVMLVGAKGSGKTTTSLTLASRGHGFLGDEIAAVRAGTGEMLPFRRAASIRTGIRTSRVTQRLADSAYPAETFPDGSSRVLANVADLFPDANPAPAKLSCVFFLRRFGPRPVVEQFSFGLEHFHLLTPLGCCMWSVPMGMRMLQMSRVLGEVRCYHLDPGSPDETADLLERVVAGLPN
jgi:hypothetical protein